MGSVVFKGEMKRRSVVQGRRDQLVRFVWKGGHLSFARGLVFSRYRELEWLQEYQTEEHLRLRSKLIGLVTRDGCRARAELIVSRALYAVLRALEDRSSDAPGGFTGVASSCRSPTLLSGRYRFGKPGVDVSRRLRSAVLRARHSGASWGRNGRSVVRKRRRKELSVQDRDFVLQSLRRRGARNYGLGYCEEDRRFVNGGVVQFGSVGRGGEVISRVTSDATSSVTSIGGGRLGKDTGPRLARVDLFGGLVVRSFLAPAQPVGLSRKTGAGSVTVVSEALHALSYPSHLPVRRPFGGGSSVCGVGRVWEASAVGRRSRVGVVRASVGCLGQKSSQAFALLRFIVEQVKPVVELVSRRKAGAVYRVPVARTGLRQENLALRWLVASARERSGSSSRVDGLVKERVEICVGNASNATAKKQEEVYKLAVLNQANAGLR